MMYEVSAAHETQIPGREPDLISWAIDRGIGPASICEGLVSPHCLLEVDMGCVPNSLACSEPLVYSWNVRRFFCLGEQRGLETRYTLKWGEACGGLFQGVLCTLGPWEEAVPAVLVGVAACLEVPPCYQCHSSALLG